MAYGKISKIDCDAAFYDDCHCRRRRDVGDSRGGPHPRLTPKGLGWRSLESPRPSNVTGSIGGSDSRGRMLVSAGLAGCWQNVAATSTVAITLP
jgi:hypothetical protein